MKTLQTKVLGFNMWVIRSRPLLGPPWAMTHRILSPKIHMTFVWGLSWKKFQVHANFLEKPANFFFCVLIDDMWLGVLAFLVNINETWSLFWFMVEWKVSFVWKTKSFAFKSADLNHPKGKKRFSKKKKNSSSMCRTGMNKEPICPRPLPTICGIPTWGGHSEDTLWLPV